MNKHQSLIAIFMLPFLLLCSLPSVMAEEQGEQWQEERMYYITVDRFFNSNSENDYNVSPQNPEGYYGGDIQGITAKLDYIKQLGFSTIWISPILSSEGYQGMSVTDFRKVDEHYGTMEELQTLVEEAHKREMNVVMDMVITETATSHSWKEEESKSDWYHDPDSTSLNLDNADVQNYMLETASYWIEETGIDGFSFPNLDEMPLSFVETYRSHVKELDEAFLLLGKLDSNDATAVNGYHEAGIDLVVNTSFSETASKAFQQPSQSVDHVFQLWEENVASLEHPDRVGLFLDAPNDRFTRKAMEQGENPATRWKIALTYMYAAPGIPVVQYGTEFMVDQGADSQSAPMMKFQSGNDELKTYMEQLAAISDQFPAMNVGDFEQVVEDGAFGVFKRTYEGESVYIVVNNDVTAKTVALEDVPQGKQLRGLLHDSIVREQDNGEYNIVHEREIADIYVVEEDTGINFVVVGFIVAVMAAFIAFVVIVSRKNKQSTPS
ncbi:alpha-amylase family glycosyl hydrolase [Pontibacillus litoralis]|uniref:Glycosyl hydrolase family 13 catalytic domain-containing protein n=1 Tax=Pontibacillus litoralis JSM 072002 TaxID=1385512 RepID=A0A0A5HW02_9BACI|nr:alpha-amylase family glycosyl hydrolase [Pontibacillus litoralis]KGX87817.1 hypothetical protein N784_14315 [Pontibacillus litoralis JSM 072002]